MTEPTRYPLAWPKSRARKTASQRKDGRFSSYGKDITLSVALDRLDDELAKLSAFYVLVSTNIEPRLDGRPRSGQGKPEDPGVCVYFQLRGKPYALACDTYSDVAQNIAALAAHVEATRAIERYGVASAAETLEAFSALPPPRDSVPDRPWWEVLGLMREMADADSIKHMFRAKAKKAHPDAGGSDAAMQELQRAMKQGLAEIGA